MPKLPKVLVGDDLGLVKVASAEAKPHTLPQLPAGVERLLPASAVTGDFGLAVLSSGAVVALPRPKADSGAEQWRAMLAAPLTDEGGSAGAVLAAAVLPDGRVAVCTARGVWAGVPPQRLSEGERAAAPVVARKSTQPDWSAAAFAADGSHVLVGGKDEWPSLWALDGSTIEKPAWKARGPPEDRDRLVWPAATCALSAVGGESTMWLMVRGWWRGK